MLYYVTCLLIYLHSCYILLSIAQNFRSEKFFAFFAQVHRGRQFLRRIILLSEMFFTPKLFLHAHDFTPGCKAVLTVSHGHQLFLTIRKRSLY